MSRRALLAVVAACGSVAHPPSPPRHTNLGLAIKRIELDNGLRVVLVPDPKAVEVELTMRYQVGAVDDPPGREGMAHLVEHLMHQQIVGGQSVLARLEASTTSFNAFTTFDTTTYVARARPERLGELFANEGVRLAVRCATITDEVFAREREVVVNEIRQDSDASRMALLESLYPAPHPYRRSVGGTEATVATITRADACAFADARYTPGNAVLVVSGSFTTEQVERGINQLLARVPKRPSAPRPWIARASTGRRITRKAPIDNAAVVVAWPLPVEPTQRARLRAIAAMLLSRVDAGVNGPVALREMGGDNAPLLAIVIMPAADETIPQVIEATQRAASGLPQWFEEDAFEQARQLALYELFSRFEEGGSRNDIIADHVFAGRDPATGVAAEIQSLTQMTRDEARDLARENLTFRRATIVTLEPDVGRHTGQTSSFGPPIHEAGQRRVDADPAEARAPAMRTTGPDLLAGMRTRILPNGLNVVLLPLTSVPTVDIRLVFRAGTADEPAGRRGLALLAGHSLSPQLSDLATLYAFYAAGGDFDITVGSDHTTYGAHGLDMHLDLLLAGLERLIRGGAYGPVDGSIERIRDTIRRRDPDAALDDAWRAGLYGPDHPYAFGTWRNANFNGLDLAAVNKFRDLHYQPDAATLIIAGGFDAALADRWIDHLFADWRGKSAARNRPRATIHPIALAKYDDTTQVDVRVVIPLAAKRPDALIAAEMIDMTIADVRHQLAASYGLHAKLDENRLATTIVITGHIASDRAPEALILVRDRIARLASADDATASLFVAARRRVITRMTSISSGAAALAGLAERNVDLERGMTASRTTAESARTLTLDAMTVLGSLDLTRAAILLRGQQDAVTRSFVALGRTPTVVH
jgi:zinc protease